MFCVIGQHGPGCASCGIGDRTGAWGGSGAGRRQAEATVTLGPQLHSPLGQSFVPLPAAVFSHDLFQMVCPCLASARSHAGGVTNSLWASCAFEGHLICHL